MTNIKNNPDIVSLSDRRQSPRVSDALALRVDSLTSTDHSTHTPLGPKPTHVVQLSHSGMRFSHDSAFETDTQLSLSIYLPSVEETVQIDSLVVASGEEPSGRSRKSSYFVQVKFDHTDERLSRLLRQQVDYVLGKVRSQAHP